MDEFSVAPLVQSDPTANLAGIPRRNAEQRPAHLAASRREGDAWVDLTSQQFYAEVRALAKGFIAAGVSPGDRLGLMSRTRYEWTLVDFAAWTAGAVVVPIYETSSAHQAEWILADSGCSAIVVESAAHAQTIAQIRDHVTALTQVWQIDSGGLDELVAAGADVNDAEVDRISAAASHEDIATIIYTSGTTGRPKGCELTHGSFLDISANVVKGLPEVVSPPGAATLLFLPLAHVLARLIQVICVDGGVKVGHSPDIKHLLPDLASYRPTFLLAVPRVFEKIYNASDAKAAAEGKGRVFRLAAKTSIAYSRALDSGGPGLGLRVQHVLFDKLVYSKLRDAMGGQVAYAVSGGGPLGERLGHFFRGIGVHVLEGYGLTETTAPAHVNLPSLTKIGTVGPPLPGSATRIAPDGEVQIKGAGVFHGYHGDPDATHAAFTEDGWLRTGDLGSLDEDGCLKITGRKKEIIVTAGGKNVAPAPLEDSIRAHPLVSQCLVVGENRPFVGALITLDREMIGAWGKAHGMPDLDLDRALTDPVVQEHLQGAVDRANAHVSRAESVRKFLVLESDFTEENGYLTPSLKLKRDLITTDYLETIDELYGGPAPRGD